MIHKLRQTSARLSRRQKLLFGGIVVIALVCAGVLFGLRLLNGPVQGSVVQIPQLPAASTAPAKIRNGPELYAGTFISFTVPANYDKLLMQQNSAYLDTAGYYASDHSSKHIAVTVIRESLASDSGLNYRRQHPALYHIDTDKQYVMYDKDDSTGSERTAFVAHGDMVATVAVSCPFQADLQDDLHTILTTLKWLQ